MMHSADSDSVDPSRVRAVGRSGRLNSLLGTVALILAVVILVREGIESRAGLDRRPRSSSRGVFRCARSPIFSLAWSPDGRRLAASGFGPVIRVWEPESGNSRWLEGDTKQPRFVLGWSPDGEHLIVGGLDVPVESWSLVDGPEGEPEVLVGPDDRSRLAEILAGSAQGRGLRLWGPSDGRLKLLPASCESANTVAFSPDGRSMASGGGDGAFQLHDLESGEVRRTRATDGRGINSVAFSPDSSRAASAGGGPVRVWDVVDGRVIAMLGEASSGSTTVAFSPDGRRVAAATWDGSIRIWDLATRRELTRFQGHLGQVVTLAWSPDGMTLASGGYDSTVRLWDVEGPAEVAQAD